MLLTCVAVIADNEMTSRALKQTPHECSCAIVGGGIHGTYLAQRLLADTSLDREDITIVDPNERLLASFRQKARACGMTTLRSTFVHHLGTEPFGLERFAEDTGRTDELVPTVDYPARPSLELFLDYADHLIDRKDLDAVHQQATVGSIQSRHDAPGVRLETTMGPIDARTCVLAIGHGDRYRLPAWARATAGVEHVWDGFDPNADVDRTIVVGGGITAGQLACALSETQSVTILSRHPIEWEVVEATPPWINWSHIEETLHAHPPGSTDRLAVIDDARHTATIPPYFYDTFDDRLADGSLTIQQGEIESARVTEDTVRLDIDDNSRSIADRVVLATGFEPVFDHPFVERIADDLGLARGARGMPILDDETLAWERANGETTPLYVTGALALGTVGPYAPNIPGARRAADRITDAIDRLGGRPAMTQLREPTPGPGEGNSD